MNKKTTLYIVSILFYGIAGFDLVWSGYKDYIFTGIFALLASVCLFIAIKTNGDTMARIKQDKKEEVKEPMTEEPQVQSIFTGPQLVASEALVCELLLKNLDYQERLGQKLDRIAGLLEEMNKDVKEL